MKNKKSAVRQEPNCIVHSDGPSGTLWSDKIPPEQWAFYSRVMRMARDRGIKFAIGGGLGLAYYTHHCRDTKDLDLYVLPQDRDRIVEVLTEIGMKDYFDEKPYERHWIYRGFLDGVIVDIIWAMPNRRTEVDEEWLTRGPEVEINGEKVRLLPGEELMWAKLYVMQRDRCDWTDLLNILYTSGTRIDWRHLLARVGDDAALLTALVTVFTWLCPDRAQALPENVRMLPKRQQGTCEETSRRADLLDSRPWFGPKLIASDTQQKRAA